MTAAAEDPTAAFLSFVASGQSDAVLELFAGEPVIVHPRAALVGGVDQLYIDPDLIELLDLRACRRIR